jgi:hypothetical protein
MRKFRGECLLYREAPLWRFPAVNIASSIFHFEAKLPKTEFNQLKQEIQRLNMVPFRK